VVQFVGVMDNKNPEKWIHGFLSWLVEMKVFGARSRVVELD